MDFDYVQTLSEEEKAYLDQFSREFYSADFSNPKKLIKSVAEIQEIYRDNNYRNQDALAYTKNTNQLDQFEDYKRVDTDRENSLIELLDRKLTSEGFFNLKQSENKTRKASKKKG